MDEELDGYIMNESFVEKCLDEMLLDKSGWEASTWLGRSKGGVEGLFRNVDDEFSVDLRKKWRSDRRGGSALLESDIVLDFARAERPGFAA